MTKTLLDHRGEPIVRKSRARELAEMMFSKKQFKASYDAARNDEGLEKYWQNADALDADSANSKDVRHSLIKRSRYEVANNGYADGIAQTYATDVVGIGPTLRMQTSSPRYNKLVEGEFYSWSQAIGLRNKLWTMAHAKHMDGESIGVLLFNPRVEHRIKLDIALYEPEQCQTPLLPFNDPAYVDGIRLDRLGNPLWYEFLDSHPGAVNGTHSLKTYKVPANRVLHWFKARRPGQHRGVPERASTLNLGAAFRRLREAKISTAEKVARWTVFLETQFTPEELEAVDPMSTLDIAQDMMTALPNSVRASQLKAEQPGPEYEEFHNLTLNEMARPINMPLNKAGCNSAKYNYASGRLDHQTYDANIDDVDRPDCEFQVLERVFTPWYELAIGEFGWLGGIPSNVGPGARFHLWNWPKHRVADVESEANANRTKLESGQISIVRLSADNGLDAEDEAESEAAYYGISVQELKRRQLDTRYPPAKTESAPVQVSDNAVAQALSNLNRRGLLPKANGNGAHSYAN